MFWQHRKQASLRWITDDLAIARQPADGEWASIWEQGIRCVVDLRAETPDNGDTVSRHGLSYLRVPITEGASATADQFAALTRWIDEKIGSEGPVLVHCREGRGRSSMVVIASLIQLGLPLHEAYKLTVRAHPGLVLNSEQQEGLAAFAAGRSVNGPGI